MRLVRNLAAGEIVGQVMLARDELGEWPKGTMAGFGPDPEAVSYTHLRAHETVLDLVCRLLLEKKKNTIAQVLTCA